MICLWRAFILVRCSPSVIKILEVHRVFVESSSGGWSTCLRHASAGSLGFKSSCYLLTTGPLCHRCSALTCIPTESNIWCSHLTAEVRRLSASKDQVILTTFLTKPLVSSDHRAKALRLQMFDRFLQLGLFQILLSVGITVRRSTKRTTIPTCSALSC